MKILVTGSSGFVGGRVTQMARDQGWDVLTHGRSAADHARQPSIVCALEPDTDWTPVLDGVDCVVHCAARVHQMNESLAEAQHAYQDVNVLGTLNLARQAAKAGVKRFIFVSSIKVNGEWSKAGQPFLPALDTQPEDPYGVSKYQAEVGLWQLAGETGLEVVVIRPPLVYGPGVKANFLSMMNWVYRALPLPFGAIPAKRSLVYLDNLADLIITCCTHPVASGSTFLVSDDHDISISQLLRLLATVMNVPSRLIPIPPRLLLWGLSLLGKRAVGQRLCYPLQLDIRATKEKLGWTPPVSLEAGLRQTVRAYQQQKEQQ
ncbi:GDP-6-deoxy-D-mannose reductase [Vibrio ruber DSM 16370]|uniref:GDP-6-deoxy-D-mannose reductase n=1 Tax=Vibrio ruber (strain DSM 16370 / JCM 11486 / BCRC 17186 / CECT 7878 / LMG 23124 / VR1) TaxID=1123498 RepID=A0A1R4LLQ7_VIBR1|nr:SDR family oxidoreductase [Vibrio ruber]SJN57307.1 GDP-6-deoxy-D-mannose reductase [Vibrio ruber DSM 16370]